MAKMRVEPAILHIDGDDFFASLARLRHPRTTGRPVVVGNLQSRGYVVAGSYEARAFGVHPGITMSQAKRLCPDAVLVQVDWDLAKRAGIALSNLLGKYSPCIEQSFLDARFVDYTGCAPLFGPAADFSRSLQREIRDDLKLSVSVGVSADKAVSAVACRAAKLGSLQAVPTGNEAAFLGHCPVEWLPGVEGQMVPLMHSLSVHTIGNLAEIPVEILEHVFGMPGQVLSRRAQGIEQARVRPDYRAGDPEDREIFSSDTSNLLQITGKLAGMAGNLGARLRSMPRSTKAICLQLFYADGVIAQRQAPISPPTNLDPVLFRFARTLLHQLFTRRVRLKGIALSARYLTYISPELPLGDAITRSKWERVLAAADKVRLKYPQDTLSIKLAASISQHETDCFSAA